MEKIDAAELKELLKDTTQKIKSANDNIAINTIVEDLISSVMNSEFASLWVFDETKAVLLRERSDDSVREISMLDQRGVLAKCFLTLTGGIYNYLASEKEYRPKTDNPDEITEKIEAVNQAMMKVSEKIYAQAQQAQQQAGGPDMGGAPDADPNAGADQAENVEDADYKVVDEEK